MKGCDDAEVLATLDNGAASAFITPAVDWQFMADTISRN